MSKGETQVRIRPMIFTDLKEVNALDRELRQAGRRVAYKDFTTHKVFGIETQGSETGKRPDMLKVAELMDLGFVAESEGRLCGFIVGRQTYLAETDIQEGEIAIIAVHPDYWGKGVATRLVNALDDLFRSRGLKRVRIPVDPLDEAMIGFLEQSGFSGDPLVYYSKKL